MTETIAEAKNKARAAALARRAGIAHEARRRAAEAVAAGALDFLAVSGTAVVAGYAPLRGEIDCMPLLARLAAEGHALALPVVAQAGPAPLAFRAWTPGEPLERGLLGVRVPAADAAPAEPEIVIVPLVAFDDTGHRLGLGAGYYDRTLRALRTLRPVTAVGLAFDEQRAGALPHDANDERLDWVLTPSGARRCQES